MSELKSAADLKWDQIMALMPMVLRLQADMRKAGMNPCAVMLPAELDPGAYDGPDATDVPAQFMGLPVVWGATVGLVVEA